jgi:hypothetical protein
MAFVIAVSLFFAILDVSLLKFLIFLDSFKAFFSPRIDRWIQDGVWQLQRRANEAHGQGTWSNLTSDVPLTGGKEMLIELPLASVPVVKNATSITPNRSHSNPSSLPNQPRCSSSQSQINQPQATPGQHPNPSVPSSRLSSFRQSSRTGSSGSGIVTPTPVSISTGAQATAQQI